MLSHKSSWLKPPLAFPSTHASREQFLPIGVSLHKSDELVVFIAPLDDHGIMEIAHSYTFFIMRHEDDGRCEAVEGDFLYKQDKLRPFGNIYCPRVLP